MANVLDQAQNFSGGPIAAARKRDRWALEEANATDPERREALREAVADLESRYPDLEDVPIGGAEAFARERGHGTGARSPVHGGRQRSGARKANRSRPGGKPSSKAPAKTPSQGKKSSGPPGLDPTARRSPAQKRAAQGRPTPKVDRAIRQTQIPNALSSSGSTVMAGLGATVGLAMLYLLVSSAETPGSGAAALPQLVGTVVRAVGRFLSLEDVFPSEAPHTGPVAGAAPVRRTASPGEVDRVERQATRQSGGKPHLPGEVGSGGIRAGNLSNPAAELQPPIRRRHRRHR
jgi:hypothetical protein